MVGQINIHFRQGAQDACPGAALWLPESGIDLGNLLHPTLQFGDRLLWFKEKTAKGIDDIL
jgi:hypothetical protein